MTAKAKKAGSVVAQVTKEQGEAAAELAQKMARAAGKVQPTLMVLACSMLIETAWMSADASSYVDFKVAKAKRNEANTQECGG